MREAKELWMLKCIEPNALERLGNVDLMKKQCRMSPSRGKAWLTGPCLVTDSEYEGRLKEEGR